MTEILLKGEQVKPRGYEPSEKLKEAILTFRQLVLQSGGGINIHQTDRDIELEVSEPPRANTPFRRMERYYVWEEDGKICGSKAEGF